MIAVQQLAVNVGAFKLHDISFAIPDRAYGVLMGKTGSGKTTLLEAICGLRRASGGTIELGGVDVTHRKAAERGIGYVPQDRALFPHMTVREHLSFALVLRKWDRAAMDRRVRELAELLCIEPLLDRYPHGLSGGEAQRIALGRALAVQPEILILDEPLSALDDETRQEMYTLLKTMQKQTKVTALHVTHSRAEASILGDLVFQFEPKAGVCRVELERV